MKSVKPRRPYRSAQRETQARATRERIVQAARKLFARNGYDATTLLAVAQEAAVAVQTVYATYGSKARSSRPCLRS